MVDREGGVPSRRAGEPTRRKPRENAGDRARIGSVVAGSYRIDEVIGRGAIGAVFGGLHLRLERPVAVKFVDPALVDDPEIRARFKREAKIAAQIGSAHAVEVFDYGVGEDGAPYLVMERLVGEDLHHRILREGRLPVARALGIAKQVCRALGAAHSIGIVHRDLKPENVFLVDRDGEPEFVKVVDFGLSTFVASDDTRLTRAGQSVGTPLYMAPEQAGAHEFDARVDVYSLGVLIFEMTTGRLPFEARTLHALLVALASEPPRSPRSYCPELPSALDELVLRFIAREPSARPASAVAALAELLALEELLAKSAVAAPADAGPVSSTAYDHTRPMERRALSDLLQAGNGAPARTPDVAPHPAAPQGTLRADAPDGSRIRASAAPRPRVTARARAAEDEVIDEDSGVFYGRMDASGRPRALREGSARSAPAAMRPGFLRDGPPLAVLALAFVAFLVVAGLILVRVLR